MKVWKLSCPNCGNANPVDSSQVEVDCGLVRYSFTCLNCQTGSQVVQDYWRWLGLEQDPQEEEVGG